MEANHNIQIKLHNKFMSTFKTRRVQETSDLHLPDYVTGLTSTSSRQSYTRISKPESWTRIEICMPAIQDLLAKITIKASRKP